MFAASDNGCLEQGHCRKVNLEVAAAVGTDNTLVAEVKVGCVKACAAVYHLRGMAEFVILSDR